MSSFPVYIAGVFGSFVDLAVIPVMKSSALAVTIALLLALVGIWVYGKVSHSIHFSDPKKHDLHGSV